MKSLDQWLKKKDKKIKNLNKDDWHDISYQCELSEEFIREFQDKVFWIYISTFQKLSEDFIGEFQDKVNWGSISEYQKLSEKSILEFKDRIYFDCIIPCFYSDKFQSEIKSSWRYKSL